MTCTRRETRALRSKQNRPFVSQRYSDLFPDSCSFASGWHDALFLIRTVTLRKSRNSWFAPHCQLARLRPSSLQSGRSVRVLAGQPQPGPGLSPLRAVGVKNDHHTQELIWFDLFIFTWSLKLRTGRVSITNQCEVKRNWRKANNEVIFKIKVYEVNSAGWDSSYVQTILMCTPWHSHRMIHKCFLFLRSKHQLTVLGSLSPYSILLG